MPPTAVEGRYWLMFGTSIAETLRGLHRIGGAALHPSDPFGRAVFVFRPKARTAWAESLDRFWDSPEMFFAQCFQGSREDSG